MTSLIPREPVPAAVSRLLNARYPTLRLRPEWLSECVAHLRSQPGPSRPTTDDQLAKQVRQQLLQTDLNTAAQTGSIASNLTSVKEGVIGEGPKNAVLLQLVSIMDIGISAATQLDVAEARKAARSTLGGGALLHPTTSTSNATASAHDLEAAHLPSDEMETEAAEDPSHMAEFNVQEEEAGRPATVFPRKMLRLELNDGHSSSTVTAFEHERIPGLDMNETKLGCKILLKGAKVRRGQVLLTRKCVTVEGGEIDSWQSDAENRLINVLRQKLGKTPLEPAQLTVAGTNAKPEAASNRLMPNLTITGPASNRTSSSNGISRAKKDEQDEFDDLDDDSLLLAAVEMEGGRPSVAVGPRTASQDPRRVRAPPPAAVETIVLSDSEEERSFKASNGRSVRGNGRAGRNNREDPIVIDSSPEP